MMKKGCKWIFPTEDPMLERKDVMGHASLQRLVQVQQHFQLSDSAFKDQGPAQKPDPSPTFLEDTLLLEPHGRLQRRREAASAPEIVQVKNRVLVLLLVVLLLILLVIVPFLILLIFLAVVLLLLVSLNKAFNLHIFILHLERSSRHRVKLSRDSAPSPLMKSNHHNKESFLVIRPRSSIV
ncbi:hypothetical protein MRB53_003910 [Persea americana]|uniref:Uncharacterized protein n=1 Tax=Persea americana TaxID=3435 RepID=A0ACC2MYM8_PERAE|nr:hypothetical protein MRB53_003910 [Persea americana]